MLLLGKRRETSSQPLPLILNLFWFLSPGQVAYKERLPGIRLCLGFSLLGACQKRPLLGAGVHSWWQPRREYQKESLHGTLIRGGGQRRLEQRALLRVSTRRLRAASRGWEGGGAGMEAAPLWTRNYWKIRQSPRILCKSSEKRSKAKFQKGL